MRGLTNGGANPCNATEPTNRHRKPIPTTTPTIRCRRCCGDGRELVDVYIGTRNGQPLYRLTPQDCTHCHGRGYLPYQPRPDSHPSPQRNPARHRNPSGVDTRDSPSGQLRLPNHT